LDEKMTKLNKKEKFQTWTYYKLFSFNSKEVIIINIAFSTQKK